jgi:hypothetical protein
MSARGPSWASAHSAGTEHERRFYVERMARGWRWSLTHSGGAYPLLRITARFLKMDHCRLMIGFRTLADGVAIMWRNPTRPSRPRAWAFVEFDGPATPTQVERRIHRTFESLLNERPGGSPRAATGTARVSWD